MANEDQNISYIDKSFTEFKGQLQQYAKTYFPNTYNDFSEATPGNMFIEMASYVGDVIGGALGAEDPQLKLISARNSVFQQIDQSNPESMLQGIKMLSQAGDQQGAMALAEYYRKAQSESALTEQRVRHQQM